MDLDYDGFLSLYGPSGDPAPVAAFARRHEALGDLEASAAAYDRAYGLDPTNLEVAAARLRVLDQLAVVEQGLVFRYIPAGTFLMGSETGDPDESPVHPVRLAPFWITDTPITWTDYCGILRWKLPPDGWPEVPDLDECDWGGFGLRAGNQVRLQYCETETTEASDWHIHHPGPMWDGDPPKTSQELFGRGPQRAADTPWTWDRKPMVAVGWQDAQDLCPALGTPDTYCALPTEAEWEKAARGGLIGCRYSWGDAPPTPERCDFGRWDQFSLRLPRALPPNAYGLYGMCGGVWDWTADRYDAAYYAQSPTYHPTGPTAEEAAVQEGRGETQVTRVLRGGSWSDAAGAATVSFRMSRAESGWRSRGPIDHISPNIGFRLVRRSRSQETGK